MNIGLFIPCYIDTFYPHVGAATLEVLEKLGQKVSYPLEQTCCGQPMANSGCERSGAATYKNFVRHFKDFDYIVTPSGSCAYHVRHHYDIIEQTAEVQKVRSSIYELCEFITDILKTNVPCRFPHKVGIHYSCHGLRGLNTASASELIEERYSKVRQLLDKAEGIDIVDLDRQDECCGFGGTFSIFEPDISVKMGRDRIADHVQHGAEFITAIDMSCLMHLDGIIRRHKKPIQVKHIAEILNTR
ncbi:MAG: (Fe-S)-binding protein [Planctomycetaceae bacterium]|jgi:L-lactate dehydrogenase complex protein LldE|nr:(Fe-S)-binding protein [Planctomycetaceae bacterium]